MQEYAVCVQVCRLGTVCQRIYHASLHTCSLHTRPLSYSQVISLSSYLLFSSHTHGSYLVTIKGIVAKDFFHDSTFFLNLQCYPWRNSNSMISTKSCEVTNGLFSVKVPWGECTIIKGSVSRQVRPLLLYIIRKLSL